MFKRHFILFFLICASVFYFLNTTWINLPDGQLHFFALNVGQGNASLIITPTGQKILIDGGPENAVLEELGAILPFYDRQLDLIILTHPHADHLSGFIPILDRFQVKAILATGNVAKNATYEIFWQKISAQKIPIYLAHAKHDFNLGGNVFLDVVYPEKIEAGKIFNNDNNSSLISRVVYKNSEILFPGDAEDSEEKELLKTSFLLTADVLQVPHHGSRTSSIPEFLNQIKSDWFVISAGKDNSYGHPHTETLAKFPPEKTLRTDLKGRIHLMTNGDGKWLLLHS